MNFLGPRLHFENRRFLTIERDWGAHLPFENQCFFAIERDLGAHLLLVFENMVQNRRFLTIACDLGAHLLFENRRFLTNTSKFKHKRFARAQWRALFWV